MHIWPQSWRVETQSAIPKLGNTFCFDQIRNISCTNALSKIMEAFVLEKLMEEVTISTNQYGELRVVELTTFS